MKINCFLILIFIAGSITELYAQQSQEEKLKTAFLNAREDTAKRKRIEDLMLFYFTDNTKSKEESIHQLQSLIKKKGDSKLNYLILLYRVVLTHTTDSIIETRKYLNEFMGACRKVDDKRNYILGLTLLSQRESYAGNYNEALKIILHSLDYARDTLKDREMTGGVYLSLGIFYSEQLDTLQAIYYNKKALEAFTETNNMASICNNLAMQYSDLGQYDSAKYYFRNSINLFYQSDLGSMISNPLSNLSLVFQRTGEYDSAIYYARDAIKHAIDLNYEESLGSGYLVLAQAFRKLNKSDSAAVYYELAKNIFEKINAQAGLRDFYPDLAGFYASTGNYKSAYDYLQKASAVKDQIFSSENNKSLKEMDAKYHAGKKEQEIALLKSQQEIESLNQSRILGIAFGMGGAFMGMVGIAFAFYMQKNKLSKEKKISEQERIKSDAEKKRSEELLLNILPAEVADEIKLTGAAKAKAYTMVTVMFSDFKDFTNVSEKVSAELLVDEIHTCFSAFDYILQKHKIEKIKTIGDAYLCASGLPVSNYTHAVDMLNAAFEIRSFMMERKKEKEARGEIPFEIRIGIHTGPVVAGIVGVRKYAYDIWGDTVNLAARMEQNSEAGKINISGNTYELVKDKFICTHRGKIQAKNKGEIDMYFVEV